MVDLIGKDLYVCDLAKDKIPALKDYLLSSGYVFNKIPYAHFSAQKNKLTVTMYLKGKLVIQGKRASEFVEFYLEPQLLKKITISGGKKFGVDYGESRIGVDESGKGDYFGPLVVASVYSDASEVPKLEELGVRDSKKLSDKQVEKLYRDICQRYPYSTVVIGPEKYNELYTRMGNLNSMLGWAHARAIENLLTKVNCSKVIIDQFADKHVVKTALLKKGRNVDLEQRHKAESDLVVAAASIVARGEFLRRLRRLGVELNFRPLKGASERVRDLAWKMYKEKGEDFLKKAVKYHFKTTEQIKDPNYNPAPPKPEDIERDEEEFDEMVDESADE